MEEEEEEAYMPCPQCKSKHVEGESIDTDKPLNPFYDTNGRLHYHDINKHSLIFVCADCKHDWTIITPHYCFCGWIQYVPLSGYQGYKKKVVIQSVAEIIKGATYLTELKKHIVISIDDE